MKLKVIKLFNYVPAFDMYVVDFIREAGKTMAVTISEDNKIGNWNIEDLEIDFQKAIKEYSIGIKWYINTWELNQLRGSTLL